MRRLALLLSIALSAPALAKNVCVQETDPFTKQTTVSARGGATLQVRAAGESQTARIDFTLGRVVGDNLPAGFTLQMLLEDGTVVDLVAPNETPGGAQASSYGAYTMFPVQFSLTGEQLQQLGASRATHLKYAMFGEEVNAAMPAGFAKKYHQAFACVAEQQR